MSTDAPIGALVIGRRSGQTGDQGGGQEECLENCRETVYPSKLASRKVMGRKKLIGETSKREAVFCFSL